MNQNLASDGFGQVWPPSMNKFNDACQALAYATDPAEIDRLRRAVAEADQQVKREMAAMTHDSR